MSNPLVLVVPAMAVPSGFYRPLVAAFHEHGWEAQALPNRGFERDQPIASRQHDWSYADEMAAVAVVMGKARADAPERPVIVMGHSLGSQIGAGHELHHPPSDGFVTVGASLPHYRSYPLGGLPVLFMGVSVPFVTRAFGYLPKPFFGGPGAQTLMREWARMVRSGNPPFEVPARITTPSLMVELEGDTYAVSKANAVFAQTLLDPAFMTRWVYTKDAVPAGGNTHHVTWAKTPDPVVDQIVTWWAIQNEATAPHR